MSCNTGSWLARRNKGMKLTKPVADFTSSRTVRFMMTIAVCGLSEKQAEQETEHDLA